MYLIYLAVAAVDVSGAALLRCDRDTVCIDDGEIVTRCRPAWREMKNLEKEE